MKIADFGIARIIGDSERNFTLTHTGGRLGSAAYMAPEQHEKPHEVDHRADIYSLGVVIYEMLTGELPLGRFPSPSQRAQVNAQVDEIVLRTLEKERGLRQQNISEVKADVEGVGSDRGKVPLGGAPSPLPPVKWSAGLWLGGLAGIAAGALTSALLMGLGLVAAVMGLSGCWWILWKIRKGLHPAEHRLPLLVIAFWPVVAGVAYMSAILWFVVFRQDDFQSVPVSAITMIPYSVLAVVLPLVVARLLWKSFGYDPSKSSSRRFKQVTLSLAVVLIVGSTALAKFVQQREFQYQSYRLHYIHIQNRAAETGDSELLRQALDRVLGNNRSNFNVLINEKTQPYVPDGFQSKVTLEFSSSKSGMDDNHTRAIFDGLQTLLPDRFEFHHGQTIVGRPFGNETPPSIQKSYRAVRALNVIVLLAPVAAVLLVCTTAGLWFSLPAIFSIVLAIAFSFTTWPGRPKGFPPSVDGLQPVSVPLQEPLD